MDITPVPSAKARIRIVGTSHIAHTSVREIEQTYARFQPDIIAVELDAGRLHALKERAAGKKAERLPLSVIKQIGVTGYLFAIIGGAVQKRMGNIMNVNPGVDMLTAVDLAQKNKKQLTLVDQDIIITMRRLSKEFTFKEKMRVLWDIVCAPFAKQKIKIQLDKVPDEKTLDALMALLKERYPSIYSVLIVERNIVMATNIDAIVRKNPGKNIMLVIGAGHGDDLRVRLKRMEHLATIE
jgi:pheromone shutdown protein TraB